ncbi:hypothetical protein M885DRAFT_591982 [Pelagophyceae sp. CCMP2097]|nr:hypothetical protein M885DRAFT_591982 [Pelagophyceae sp. CCMP2097]
MMDAALMSSMELTRRLLAPLISAPALSAGMLAKPPVAFLFAVFSAVRQATGFGVGLLDDDGVDDGSPAVGPATRRDKVSFLVRLVACAADALGDESVLVRVDPLRVLGGGDATGANALLQALARAAARGEARSNRAVKRILETGDARLYEHAVRKRAALVIAQARCRGNLARGRCRAAAAVAGRAAAALAEGAAAAAARVAAEGASALDEAQRRAAQLAGECERRLLRVEAAEAHIRVQSALLERRAQEQDDAARALSEREAAAQAAAARNRRDLQRLKPLREREQRERREARARADGAADHAAPAAAPAAPAAAEAPAPNSARSRASAASASFASTSRTAGGRRGRRRPSAADGVGADYVAASRQREKGRQRQLDSRCVGGEAVTARPDSSPEPSPDFEMRRVCDVLGGREGVFGAFLRDQLAQLQGAPHGGDERGGSAAKPGRAPHADAADAPTRAAADRRTPRSDRRTSDQRSSSPREDLERDGDHHDLDDIFLAADAARVGAAPPRERPSLDDLFERGPPALPPHAGSKAAPGRSAGRRAAAPARPLQKAEAAPPSKPATHDGDVAAPCGDASAARAAFGAAPGSYAHGSAAGRRAPRPVTADDDEDYGQDDEFEEDDSDSGSAAGDQASAVDAARQLPSVAEEPRRRWSPPPAAASARPAPPAEARAKPKRAPRERPPNAAQTARDHDAGDFLCGFDDKFNRALKKLEGGR